ncbi:multiple cyclophane-containing RiPP AmcA [Plantactinospora sp. CA-290183]|uniref:multiple cyclophane-containing RiPP AmcA n=1 Tax=Plantactinospora sp. CA-290183 TaxID=3240006 RepID=UPI003D8DA9E4
MPETRRRPQPESVGEDSRDPVAARVRGARAGLAPLLQEAAEARLRRAEVPGAGDGASAVCAWNHFENIPTFYNWNNRPR